MTKSPKLPKYVIRKFKTETLKQLLGDDDSSEDGIELKMIREDLTDNTRWEVHYSVVFEYGDKYYQFDYSRGATEHQDQELFPYDGLELECREVKEVETTVIIYQPILIPNVV